MVASASSRALYHFVGADLKTTAQLQQLLIMPVCGAILFIDEIHSVRRELLEALYILMEDGRIAGNTSGQLYTLPGPLTVIGATTELGELPKPLVDRFRLHFHLEPYNIELLVQMGHQLVDQQFAEYAQWFTPKVVRAAAAASRGIPRTMSQVLYQLKDVFCVYKPEVALLSSDSVITDLMAYLGYFTGGLDSLDIKILAALYTAQQPLGVEALAAITGENIDTVAGAREPHLLRLRLIERTPQGRRLTPRGLWVLAYEGAPRTPPVFMEQHTPGTIPPWYAGVRRDLGSLPQKDLIAAVGAAELLLTTSEVEL